jgi:hypothetical protein
MQTLPPREGRYLGEPQIEWLDRLDPEVLTALTVSR